MTDLFGNLPRGHFGAILADPPWRFNSWGGQATPRKQGKNYGFRHPTYETMEVEDICALPVADLTRPDCVLFLWTCWPMLMHSAKVINAWGFVYKSCAFSWMKAHAQQLELFQDDIEPRMGLGYWTRSNSEVCLLGTRGNPKRLNPDVRQGIIEPIREHSRKPDCVHGRIERLVAGPYLELFARQRHPGWDCWGNEVDKFGGEYDAHRDIEGSFSEAYRAIRERKAAGGPGWEPK